MKRGRFEPREVINDQLTANEEKVLFAWSKPSEDGKSKTVYDIAKEAGLSTQTTLRHLATLELWVINDKTEKRKETSNTNYEKVGEE